MLRNPTTKERSPTNLIQKAIAFKHWLSGPPPIEAARPTRCPWCPVPARETGGLGIVGHGVRTREVRGPERPMGPPRSVVIHCRRCRCQSCRAILTVVPMEVGFRHRYALPAMLWAIALYGLDGLLARSVRRRVSPDRMRAEESRWRQLGRWIDQRSASAGDRRARARVIARRAAARSGPENPITSASAWDGAMMSIVA